MPLYLIQQLCCNRSVLCIWRLVYATDNGSCLGECNDRSSSDRCCQIFITSILSREKAPIYICVDSYQWNRFYACIYHDRIYCRPSFRASAFSLYINRDRSYLSICSCIPVRFDYELFHSEETTENAVDIRNFIEYHQ